MLFKRINQCLDELGLPPSIDNVHEIFRMLKDLYPERKEILELRAAANNARMELKVQKRRTDIIRDAVYQYLSGDATKRKLQQALDDSDYSVMALEGES